MAAAWLLTEPHVDVGLQQGVGRREGGAVGSTGGQCDGAAADGDQGIGYGDVGQHDVAGVGDSEGVADGLTDLGEAVAVLILERAALDDGNQGSVSAPAAACR